jgi:hypothetical protein
MNAYPETDSSFSSLPCVRHLVAINGLCLLALNIYWKHQLRLQGTDPEYATNPQPGSVSLRVQLLTALPAMGAPRSLVQPIQAMMASSCTAMDEPPATPGHLS